MVTRAPYQLQLPLSSVSVLALSSLLLPVIAFLTSFLAIRWMLANPNVCLALDHPNERSLHRDPIPRTGGIAMMGGWLAGILSLLPQYGAMAGCTLALVCVSLVDDWRGLSVGWRFLAHSLVAATFVWIALPGIDPFLRIMLAVGIVWMSNLYNFMDGSDGLAGGMALVGFGSYAGASALAGDTTFALCWACAAAAATGFLIFNFHPARIFMGDAGSVPLGFLAAAGGLVGCRRNLWPLWFPVLVFSPFIVDASATLVKRLARREKVWRAHREHYYQRMVRSGLGHRSTALVWYVVMLAAGISALAALRMRAQTQSLVLVGWALIYILAAFAVDRLWSRHLSEQRGGTDAK